MKLAGFLHLTWWVHPEDPTWFNEISFWINRESLRDWHMDIYHKHAKEWAARGAIMEDIITNFELQGTRLLRVCPCCGLVRGQGLRAQSGNRKPWREPCPKCNFTFPVMAPTPSSFAVFKDIGLPVEAPVPIEIKNTVPA